MFLSYFFFFYTEVSFDYFDCFILHLPVTLLPVTVLVTVFKFNFVYYFFVCIKRCIKYCDRIYIWIGVKKKPSFLPQIILFPTLTLRNSPTVFFFCLLLHTDFYQANIFSRGLFLSWWDVDESWQTLK